MWLSHLYTAGKSDSNTNKKSKKDGKSAKNEKSAKDNGQKKNESALYTVDCSSYHNNITVSEHVYSINSYSVYYVML